MECYWEFVDGNSMDMMKFIMLYGFSDFVSGMNHGGCSILGGIAGFSFWIYREFIAV